MGQGWYATHDGYCDCAACDCKKPTCEFPAKQIVGSIAVNTVEFAALTGLELYAPRLLPLLYGAK